jgi:DNA mismatch repair ATPase MutL
VTLITAIQRAMSSSSSSSSSDSEESGKQEKKRAKQDKKEKKRARKEEKKSRKKEKKAKKKDKKDKKRAEKEKGKEKQAKEKHSQDHSSDSDFDWGGSTSAQGPPTKKHKLAMADVNAGQLELNASAWREFAQPLNVTGFAAPAPVPAPDAMAVVRALKAEQGKVTRAGAAVLAPSIKGAVVGDSDAKKRNRASRFNAEVSDAKRSSARYSPIASLSHRPLSTPCC